MDRRNFIKTAGFAAGGLVLASCAPLRYAIKESMKDGKYDFDDFLVDCYDELMDNIVEIDVNFDTKKYGKQKKGGSGFRYGNKILTANHVVDDSMAILTPFGPMEINVNPEEKSVLVDGEETCIIKTMPEYDIAILEGKELDGIKIGNSDELDIGNYIVIGGKTYDIEKTIKGSRVSALKLEYEPYKKYIKDVPYNEVVVVHPRVDIGDSGGYVCAFRDGEPEIVGMNKIRFYDFGGVHKINHIISAMGDI